MDVFNEIEFDKIKDEFYKMAINDFNHGMSLSGMQEVLRSYEEMEMYEACAGIKKAMDEAETLRNLVGGLKNLMNHIKTQEDE